MIFEDMADNISFREFSRQIGVSAEAVSKAVRVGRIPPSAIGEIQLSSGRMRPVIKDIAAALAGWYNSTNPRNSAVTETTTVKQPDTKSAPKPIKEPRKKREKKTSVVIDLSDQFSPAAKAVATTEVTDEESAEEQLQAGTFMTLAAAKLAREGYQAKLAKLDFEERSGNLISTEKVRIAQFTQGQLIREAVLNMPDRIAAQLAAELGREISAHVVRTVMDTELRNILIEVAKFGRSNAN